MSDLFLGLELQRKTQKILMSRVEKFLEGV
jgi:hypothetical protein